MNAFTVDASIRRSQWREDATARCWAVARQSVFGLSLALACQCVLAQTMYRIRPLGYLGGCTTRAPTANGFNEAGQVTGYACSARGTYRAFLWKHDGTPMVDLGPDEPNSESFGVALNASGVVAGFAQHPAGYDTNQYAFVSSGDGTPMTRIPDTLGGITSGASDINDLGQLTGDAYTVGNITYHAYVWKNDGSPMQDLGTLGGDYSYSSAINNTGQVAGSSDLPGNTATHAFIWKNDGSPMQDLGTLGGDYSYGYFINASGQVAGTSTLQTAKQRSHAFFWRNDGTPMQDLRALAGRDSVATALNDLGQVAGYSDVRQLYNYHAFVWLNDGTPIKDLGTFGGTQSRANGINSSGQVTGWALLANGGQRAFLWKNDGSKKQDLNKLVDPTDPLKRYVILISGEFVNDQGDILAYGSDNRRGGDQGLYLVHGTVLVLAPRSLAFGNQPINTTSATKAVTVTNTSSKVVPITSIALTGSAAGQFASTNNCDKSLVGYATCTIKVTFKPTTKGARAATLNVNGGDGGLSSVTLTGTAT